MSDTHNHSLAAWEAIKPYWNTISVYDGPAAFLESIALVPEQVRHLLAVHWCDSEVCNGGFEQLFRNSTGVIAPEAVDGYRSMGMEELAQIAESAMKMLGETYPRDRQIRIKALESAARLNAESALALFADLDNRYYAERNRLNFDEVRGKFAKQNTGH